MSNTGRAPANPNAAVSPGEMAMPCASTRPSRASACTAASRRPLPVPPMAMIASACSSASACFERAPPHQARCRRISRPSPRALRARRRSTASPRRCRGDADARRANRHLGNTCRRPRPRHRARASARRLRRNGVRAVASPPAGNTPSPGVTAAIASARSPRTVTASSGATASVPRGSGSPLSTRGGSDANGIGA